MLNTPFFSIIVVSLNAENLIKMTIDSVLSQTNQDFEIIVKDGLSKDKTLDNIPTSDKIKVFSESDSGTYDAMNQATKYAVGKYVIYMNCGDIFASDDVLELTKKKLEPYEDCVMAYGDYIYVNNLIKSPKKMNGYKFYRNLLCHQAIFFNRNEILKSTLYNTDFWVIADYDLEVRLFKTGGRLVYLDTTVCKYLGGGYSEQPESIIANKAQRKASNKINFSLCERILYSLVWHMTLPTVRSKIFLKFGASKKIYYKITNLLRK